MPAKNKITIRYIFSILTIVLITAVFQLTLISCDDESDDGQQIDCWFYITGQMDTDGDDADMDGVTNGWDVCPDNPNDWLDSDKDGIGNKTDMDVDGDGILNQDDEDIDWDGVSNEDEIAAGTDPYDPTSIPGKEIYDYDQGIMNSNPGWYKGDLHMHTTFSDGTVMLVDRIDQGESYEHDFIALTDHSTTNHIFSEDFTSSEMLLIPGMEYTLTSHFNEFGLRTNNFGFLVDEPLIESWMVNKMQGGLLSLNHYADGSYRGLWDDMVEKFPDIVEMLDAIEIWNGENLSTDNSNYETLMMVDEILNAGHKLAVIGGSDAHGYSSICFPTTFVYASNLSLLAILDGIRQGRTYVASPYPLYTTGSEVNYSQVSELTFEADSDGNGTYDAMIGDTLSAGTITFHVGVTNAYGTVNIIRNGEVLQTYSGLDDASDLDKTFTDTPDSYSWYRVEMFIEQEDSNKYLLVSSAIYVDI